MKHYVFVALLCACNTPTDPTTPEYWVYRLDREKDREEALRKLGELKNAKAVDPLLKLFQESPKDRPAIAETLGAIADKKAAPALMSAIDLEVATGSDEPTRLKNKTNEKAATALGNMKATEASELLMKLYGRSNDQYVKQAAVTAMTQIPDSKFVPTLADIIQHNDNMYLKRVAAEALGNIGDAGGVPALIEGMFIEKGGSIYPQASFALLQIGPAAIPALLDTLQGKNAAVTKIVTEKKFLPGVVEIKTTEVLGDLHAKQAEDAIIKTFTEFKAEETQAVLRLNSARALAQLGGAKSVALLVKNANEPAGDLRKFFVDALNELSDRSALPALLSASSNGKDPDGKLAAFIAYTRLGGAGELASATALTNGKDEVAQHMKTELVRLTVAKECADTYDCWVGKLKDKDARVREKAAYWLGRSGNKKAADALVAVVKDENLETRYAIFWALSKLGGKAHVPALEKVLVEEKGQQSFVRVNEYLKRLIIDLKRAA